MTTSYANFGGTGGTRIGEFEVTTTATTGGGGGNVLNLFDGLFGTNSNQSWFWNSGQTTRVVQFDWGPGALIVIDEFKWYQDNGSTHGTWVWEGGDDTLTTWTQVGSSFTLGGSSGANTYTQGGSTGYRAYRLRQTSGSTSNSPWLEELEFKIEDVTPVTAHPSLNNTGGQGNRTSTIATSTTFGLSGTVNNLVDGGFGDNTTDSVFFNPNGPTSGNFVFDFGVGASKVINGFAWLQSDGSTHGTWVLEGSNDGSSYTGIGSSFTLGGGTRQPFFFFTNTTGYRYYRLRITGGAGSNSPFLREIEFKIMDAAVATPVKAYKVTEYAVIQAPSGPVDAYKVTEYAVVVPDSKVFKATEYAVIEPPPPEVEFTPLEAHFDGQPLAAYHDPQPAGLIAGTEAFASDTGQFTKYTESSAGSFTATGTGEIVHNAGVASDLNDIVTVTAATFSIPNIFASIEVTGHSVTSGTYDNIGVGIFKDANNFVLASFDTVSNLARVQIKIAGSSSFVGSIGHTLQSLPTEIGFSLVGNMIAVYEKIAGVWTVITTHNVSGTYDFRTAGNLSGFKAGFTLASHSNSTWDFDNLKWGSAGGVGMRDMTVVTNEDGTTYLENNRYVYFTATVGAPEGVDGSYCGVFKLDHNTLAYAQTGVIYVSRSGAYYNDQACHLIPYPNGDTRITIATWGNGFSSTLQVQHKLETGVDLLNGVHLVASMSTLALPLSTQFVNSGAYDSFLVYDDVHAKWLIGYAVVDNTNFSGSNFYPVASTSPDLTTWTLVGEDSGGAHAFEGVKILRADPAAPFYIMAGGLVGDGIFTIVYDQDMNFLGSLDSAAWGGTTTQPHPMVYALRSKYFLLTFNDTKGTAADFSWGQPTLQSANRYVADNYQKPLTADFDIDESIDTVKWTWRSQSTSTAISSGGVLELAIPAGSSFGPRSIEQPLTSNKVKLRTKVTSSFTDTNFCSGGIYVKNSANSKGIFFGYNRAFGANFEAFRATLPSTFSTGLGPFSLPGDYHDDPKYFEIECDGTDLFLRTSVDGCTWTLRYTEHLATFVGDIDTMGLFANSENSNPVSIFYSWMHDVTPTEWVKKVTEYAVLEPTSTPVDVYKSTEYAIIQPAAQAKKITEYAVIEPNAKAFVFKDTEYAVIAANALVYKDTEYAVIAAPVLVYKDTEYAVIAPNSRVFKDTEYAVLAPVNDAFVFKTNEYAVIQRPRPDVYKVTEYSVLAPVARTYKSTEYAVIQPAPPIRTYKATEYAVVMAPPVESAFDNLITLSNLIPTGSFTHYMLRDFNFGADTSARFELVLFGKESPSADAVLVRYTIQDYGNLTPFSPLPPNQTEPITTVLSAAALGVQAGDVTVTDVVYDTNKGQIGVFFHTALESYYVLLDTQTNFVQGTANSTSVPYPSNHSFNPRRDNVSKDYRYISGDNIVTIDENLALTIDTRTLSGVGAPAYAGAQYYDGARRAIRYVDENGDLSTLWTQRYVGEQASVAEILRRVLMKAGFDEDFFDVSAVTDITIEGYLVRDQTSAMNVIQELIDFFHISMTDSGGKLTFRSLASGDTLEIDPNHFHNQMTTRTVDVTDQITSAQVEYYDIDTDDNDSFQLVTRDAFTDFADFVSNTDPLTYKAAVFTTGARARRSAEVFLYQNTQRADTRTVYLAPYHLAVEPSDLIGEDFRVHKLTINANLELLLEAGSDSPDSYVLTNLAAADNLDFVDTTLKDFDHGVKNFPVLFSVNPAKFGAMNNAVYAGLVNPDDTPFVSTEMRLLGQGSFFARLGTPTGELVYGRVLNPPAAGRTNMFTTDVVSQLVIRFNKAVPAGALTNLSTLVPNYTDPQNNLLIVGKELIQYKNYTIDIDGQTVTFTGLSRGRFGTDEFANAHVVGEAAAVFNADRMFLADLPSATSNIGVAEVITLDPRAPTMFHSEGVQVYDAISRSWTIGRLNIKKEPGIQITFRIVPRLPYANGFFDGETDLNTSYGQNPFVAVLRAPFDLDMFMANFVYIANNNYLSNPYIARVFNGGTGNTDMTVGTAVYNALTMGVDGISFTDDLYLAAFILDLGDSENVLKSAVRGFLFEGTGDYATFKTGLDA